MLDACAVSDFRTFSGPYADFTGNTAAHIQCCVIAADLNVFTSRNTVTAADDSICQSHLTHNRNVAAVESIAGQNLGGFAGSIFLHSYLTGSTAANVTANTACAIAGNTVDQLTAFDRSIANRGDQVTAVAACAAGGLTADDAAGIQSDIGRGAVESHITACESGAVQDDAVFDRCQTGSNHCQVTTATGGSAVCDEAVIEGSGIVATEGHITACGGSSTVGDGNIADTHSTLCFICAREEQVATGVVFSSCGRTAVEGPTGNGGGHILTEASSAASVSSAADHTACSHSEGTAVILIECAADAFWCASAGYPTGSSGVIVSAAVQHAAVHIHGAAIEIYNTAATNDAVALLCINQGSAVKIKNTVVVDDAAVLFLFLIEKTAALDLTAGPLGSVGPGARAGVHNGQRALIDIATSAISQNFTVQVDNHIIASFNRSIRRIGAGQIVVTGSHLAGISGPCCLLLTVGTVAGNGAVGGVACCDGSGAIATGQNSTICRLKVLDLCACCCHSRSIVVLHINFCALSQLRRLDSRILVYNGQTCVIQADLCSVLQGQSVQLNDHIAFNISAIQGHSRIVSTDIIAGLVGNTVFDGSAGQSHRTTGDLDVTAVVCGVAVTDGTTGEVGSCAAHSEEVTAALVQVHRSAFHTVGHTVLQRYIDSVQGAAAHSQVTAPLAGSIANEAGAVELTGTAIEEHTAAVGIGSGVVHNAAIFIADTLRHIYSAAFVSGTVHNITVFHHQLLTGGVYCAAQRACAAVHKGSVLQLHRAGRGDSTAAVGNTTVTNGTAVDQDLGVRAAQNRTCVEAGGGNGSRVAVACLMLRSVILDHTTGHSENTFLIDVDHAAGSVVDLAGSGADSAAEEIELRPCMLVHIHQKRTAVVGLDLGLHNTVTDRVHQVEVALNGHHTVVAKSRQLCSSVGTPLVPTQVKNHVVPGHNALNAGLVVVRCQVIVTGRRCGANGCIKGDPFQFVHGNAAAGAVALRICNVGFGSSLGGQRHHRDRQQHGCHKKQR